MKTIKINNYRNTYVWNLVGIPILTTHGLDGKNIHLVLGKGSRGCDSCPVNKIDEYGMGYCSIMYKSEKYGEDEVPLCVAMYKLDKLRGRYFNKFVMKISRDGREISLITVSKLRKIWMER